MNNAIVSLILYMVRTIYKTIKEFFVPLKVAEVDFLCHYIESPFEFENSRWFIEMTKHQESADTVLVLINSPADCYMCYDAKKRHGMDYIVMCWRL